MWVMARDDAAVSTIIVQPDRAILELGPGSAARRETLHRSPGHE